MLLHSTADFENGDILGKMLAFLVDCGGFATEDPSILDGEL